MEKEAQVKTEFKGLSPNLMVDDVNKTVAYYKDYLGFAVDMTTPEEGEWLWAMVRYGSVTIMFHRKDSMVEEFPHLKGVSVGGGSFLIYIEVTGVEKLYEDVKANKNVSIVQDLHDKAYNMREFAIKDCNGYALTFGETINQ